MPKEDGEMEDGGTRGAQTGTLLPFLRKFILAIMFVMVSLIILFSLGVTSNP